MLYSGHSMTICTHELTEALVAFIGQANKASSCSSRHHQLDSMGITSVIVPEESNLADTQDKHFAIIIINMIKELKGNKNKCLDKDFIPSKNTQIVELE